MKYSLYGPLKNRTSNRNIKNDIWAPGSKKVIANQNLHTPIIPLKGEQTKFMSTREV
jgi:hypothetical protein